MRINLYAQKFLPPVCLMCMSDVSVCVCFSSSGDYRYRQSTPISFSNTVPLLWAVHYYRGQHSDWEHHLAHVHGVDLHVVSIIKGVTQIRVFVLSFSDALIICPHTIRANMFKFTALSSWHFLRIWLVATSMHVEVSSCVASLWRYQKVNFVGKPACSMKVNPYNLLRWRANVMLQLTSR